MPILPTRVHRARPDPYHPPKTKKTLLETTSKTSKLGGGGAVTKTGNINI